MTIEQIEKEVESKIEKTAELFIDKHSPVAWTDETHAEFLVGLVESIATWGGRHDCMVLKEDGFPQITQLRLTIAMKYKGLGLDRSRFGKWLEDEGYFEVEGPSE